MEQRKYKKHFKIITIIFFIISLIITLIGVIKGEQASLFIGISFLITFLLYMYYNKQLKIDESEYLHNLSHLVKKVSNEAFSHLPVGIAIYDEEDKVIWSNQYVDKIYGKKIKNLSVEESIFKKDFVLKDLGEKKILHIKDRYFEVSNNEKSKTLYYFDITEFKNLESLYHKESLVLGIISLDNYDETLEHMDEQTKSDVVSRMASVITNWASDNEIFIRRYTRSHYIAVLNENILDDLKKDNFRILDDVRDTSEELGFSLTLSIGIGRSTKSIIDLGDLAKVALDLSLSRGGDQVAIKGVDGDTQFFGGRAEALEKRTRVRARVISQSIQNLIRENDNVVIMGHKNPDYDSIGASIGIYKLSEALGKDAYIVNDPNVTDRGVLRLIEELKGNDIYDSMVNPSEALNLMSPKTLLVVVDNHKPQLVISKEVLDASTSRVVIDHHRRGDDFIPSPLVTYLESYASSTCELVTELMEYLPHRAELGVLEATTMLAGIIVDTNHFSVRTGQRTFDAAAFLKSYGADTIMIQDLLKEDLTTYINQSSLIKRAKINNGMAIVKAGEDDVFDQIFIAKIADQLLTFNNIKASFVISTLENGTIGVSARSLAEINVQIVMEAMGGGGHLTSAAVQLADTTLDQVHDKLVKAIEDIYRKGADENESNFS